MSLIFCSIIQQLIVHMYSKFQESSFSIENGDTFMLNVYM